MLVEALPPEVAAAVGAADPVTPELMLVSPPDVARLARQKLPEPEGIDEWLRRMRRQDAERAARELMTRARERRERRRSAVGAAAFAAACVLASAAPMLAQILLG